MMDDATTYDVRVYKTDIYRGARVTTYRVRWKVARKTWKTSFRNAAQADSFRSSLVAAARNGEAFSLTTGRPVSWQREESVLSWYAFTLDYSAAKWPYVSPSHRRGIAEALTDATETMLSHDDLPCARERFRHVLRTWAYGERLRSNAAPADDIATVVAWLETGTVALAELAQPGSGPARIRAMLDRLSRKQDGKPAAANTAVRKRIVVNNAMEYACEIGALPANPLKSVKWTRPRTLTTVDPRVVINPAQALKHRADGDTRHVPIHPELVTMLREHLEEFGTGPGGRLFIGPRGGIITDRAYLKVFHDARTQALTAREASSPLLEVPYALRHAAVSTWLTAGVAPPQVAEWAGHSVAILLRIYAKCISGQQDEAMRRISDATQDGPPGPESEDGDQDEDGPLG